MAELQELQVSTLAVCQASEPQPLAGLQVVDDYLELNHRGEISWPREPRNAKFEALGRFSLAEVDDMSDCLGTLPWNEAVDNFQAFCEANGDITNLCEFTDDGQPFSVRPCDVCVYADDHGPSLPKPSRQLREFLCNDQCPLLCCTLFCPWNSMCLIDLSRLGRMIENS